jgi:hypothetical protein
MYNNLHQLVSSLYTIYADARSFRIHQQRRQRKTLQIPTHLFNQFPCNRMELFLRMHKKFLCESRVDFTRGTERRTAKLHATLNDSCAISSGHPFERVVGKIRRRGRLGVLERDIVETQADLGIRGSSHPIQRTELLYVSWREGFVGREAFEEDNYNTLRTRRWTDC